MKKSLFSCLTLPLILGLTLSLGILGKNVKAQEVRTSTNEATITFTEKLKTTPDSDLSDSSFSNESNTNSALPDTENSTEETLPDVNFTGYLPETGESWIASSQILEWIGSFSLILIVFLYQWKKKVR